MEIIEKKEKMEMIEGVPYINTDLSYTDPSGDPNTEEAES